MFMTTYSGLIVYIVWLWITKLYIRFKKQTEANLQLQDSKTKYMILKSTSNQNITFLIDLSGLFVHVSPKNLILVCIIFHLTVITSKTTSRTPFNFHSVMKCVLFNFLKISHSVYLFSLNIMFHSEICHIIQVKLIANTFSYWIKAILPKYLQMHRLELNIWIWNQNVLS